MTKSIQSKLLRRSLSVGAVGLLLSTTTPAFAASNNSTSSNSTSQTQQQIVMPTPPTTKALSVVLMDADNGQILYEKNPTARRAPASTTKLMTMLLVMKAIKEHKISWTDQVPVTPSAYKLAMTPGISDAFLDPQKHYTLEEMMRYIAVISANDATVAVADRIAGDRASFVAEMNQEAKKIGLTGTHYMNPDGLNQKDHYTTALDLAKLADYIVTYYPGILKFTSLPDVHIIKTRAWHNTDRLLGNYPGIDGLKTGYTDQAGYCFVGTAAHGSVRLISVVMGDTTTNEMQRFVDTSKLLNYGFQQFSEANALKKGQTLTETAYVKDGKDQHLAVTTSNGLLVDLPTGVKGQLRVTTDSMTAPVKQGQQVGSVEYVLGNQVLAQSPLVAAKADPRANWLIRMFRHLGSWFRNLLHHL